VGARDWQVVCRILISFCIAPTFVRRLYTFGKKRCHQITGAFAAYFTQNTQKRETEVSLVGT